MAMNRKKRPRDPVQLGKLVVDIATGKTLDSDGGHDLDNNKRRAGREGGSARSKALTSAERSEIARIAAEARWRKADS